MAVRFVVRVRRAALLGLMIAPQANGGVPGAVARDRVVEIVTRVANRRDADDKERRAALKELVGLGPEAAPATWGVLSGDVDGSSLGVVGPLVTPDVRALLIDALRTWPVEDVLGAIERAVAEDSSLSDRMRAIEVVGQLGDGAVRSLVRLVEDLSLAELQHPLVDECFQDAVAELLEGDPDALAVLAAELGRIEPVLLPGLASAVGRRPSADAFGLLERILGRSRHADLAVLAAFGAWPRWRPEAEACAALVRGHVDANDPRVRHAAILASGHLADTIVARDLVDLLDDSEPRLRSAALWALQEISGLHWEADEARWGEWAAGEDRWLADEAQRLDALGHEDDPALVASTLQSLSAHRLLRRELVPRVVPLLARAEPHVVAAAAAALARLGAAEAVPELVDALGHPDPSAREAVASALRALTGERMPPRRREWRDWLER